MSDLTQHWCRALTHSALYATTLQADYTNSNGKLTTQRNLQFLLHGRVKGRGVYIDDVRGLGTTGGYRGGLDCTFGE
jgi:hypothetical protein